MFDLDGVVLDTEKIYDDCFRAVSEMHGKKLPDEILLKTKGTEADDCINTIINGLKLNVSKEVFGKDFEKLATEKCRNAKLMPGIDRITRHLYYYGIPMAVATSNSKRWFDLLTEKHKLYFTLIHHVVTSADDPEVKRGKPAPDIFLVCASRFKEKPDPSKVLVFEDSHNGLQAALAAGMQCAMLPEKITPLEKREGATQVLRHLYKFDPEAYGWPPFRDVPADDNIPDSDDENPDTTWPPV
ncbi:pseudouridine-5'-phosphatase isoform X2 [Bemisia tabaci]|uniref:pseudouridine-5'-phosphatase isoform X2 n=1 Tax=Bemisia tabaci TaxID=7038 RepID=UPI003B286DE1